MTMTNKPEGWYPDPVDSAMERHWNGNAWTDRTRRGGVESVPFTNSSTIPEYSEQARNSPSFTSRDATHASLIGHRDARSGGSRRRRSYFGAAIAVIAAATLGVVLGPRILEERSANEARQLCLEKLESSANRKDLSGCDLSGTSLYGDFTGSRFNVAKLTRTSLVGDFTDADFSGANMEGAEFYGARPGFLRAKFRDTDLRGTQWMNAAAVKADFRGADLSGAALAAWFNDADFTGAIVTCADFSKSLMEGARKAWWWDPSCPVKD